MELLASVGRPLVHVLSVSTDALLRLLRVRQVKQPGVTAEEIRVLLEQGTLEGVFERSEHEMMTNVLNLDERRIGAVLTPRSDVVYLDIRDPIEVNRGKLRQDPHTVLPLCDGGLDQVRGFVRSTRVTEQLLDGRPLDLVALAEPPLRADLDAPRPKDPHDRFFRRVNPGWVSGDELVCLTRVHRDNLTPAGRRILRQAT